MDWARAKVIILSMLLVFNIYLLTSIYGYVRGEGITAETIENTEKILASRGVRLECEIPRYDSDTPKLVIDNQKPDVLLLAEKLLGKGYEEEAQGGTYINGGKKLTFDGNVLLSYTDGSPAGTVELKRKNAVENYAHDFLTDKGLIDSSYILDEKKANSDGSIYLSYLEKYKDFLVYDNYTRVIITEKGVTRIEMQKSHIIRQSPEKTGDIATAYQVLLGNFDGKTSVTITGIDIGYKAAGTQDANGLQSSEQLPAWRIKTAETAGLRYFSLADGKEIK